MRGLGRVLRPPWEKRAAQLRGSFLDGDVHERWLQHALCVFWVDGDQKAAGAAVDVNQGGIQDRALHVDGHGALQTEGGGAADLIAGVAVGDFGTAGGGAAFADQAGELLGGYFAVAVHQDAQGLFGVVFEDERFDDEVFVDAEGRGRMSGAAVQFERVEVRLEADLCGAQCSDGERDWELHRP